MGSVATFWLLFGRSKSDSAGESRGPTKSPFIFNCLVTPSLPIHGLNRVLEHAHIAVTSLTG
jgi:hypothetical protein